MLFIQIILGIILIFIFHELIRYSEYRRQKRVAQDFKEEWAYQKKRMMRRLERMENVRKETK